MFALKAKEASTASLNIVRGCAAHSALLLPVSDSHFCTPLTTVAGEATDLIAANHTLHKLLHLMTDTCLTSLCYSNPVNQHSFNVPSAPASQRPASCNKICVFVCSARVLRIILVGNVARIGVKRNVFIVLVEKPE